MPNKLPKSVNILDLGYIPYKLLETLHVITVWQLTYHHGHWYRDP